MLREDEARETVSGWSHGPFGVDSCRNVGREEGGLWRVEVLNGGFDPNFDPGRRSVLPLPVAYGLSSGSPEEEDGRRALGRDEEVDGRRSGAMRSKEVDSVGPEVLVWGKRDFVEEGGSVEAEWEDRDARGMWEGEFGLADEKTRLDCGN